MEGNQEVVSDEYWVAMNKANIVVVLVDHSEFKSLSLEIIKNKIVIDTRGLIQ